MPRRTSRGSGATRRSELDGFLVSVYGRRRKRLARQRRKRRAALVVAAILFGSLAIVLSVGFGAGAALSMTCSLSSLRAVDIGANSFVYAADGSLLGTIPAERNREPVPLSQMSPWLAKATVAIEDWRFYQHGGIDYLGIARALWVDIKAGKVVEGGSTIDQQLVRNLYVGSEQTFQRKLKEACLAIKLNARWPKSKILATYLNTVYYGNRAYGVEAASQTYYSQDARSLDLPQAALMAGLPQAPSVFDPLDNPAGALARRAAVLKAMLNVGVITHRDYRWAARQPLALHPGAIFTKISQPYFFSYVIDELESFYGANVVREGGLHVYTTIEPRLQVAANQAIRSTLNEHGDPAAAIVSVEPGTGAIRAMTAVVPGVNRPTSTTSPPSRRGRRGRRSSPSCSPPRSRRAWIRTRPTTPQRRLPARAGPGAARTISRASRGR